MTMTNFWIVSGITVVVTLVCMIINNAQHTILKHLHFFLGKTVKASLILNGEPHKARQITLNEIPKIEGWFNECRNYGWINIFGMTSVLGLLISGGFYHRLNIIVTSSCALFFLFNILFLPKAFTRLNKAISITNNYSLLMAALNKAEENKKQTSVDPETLI